MRTRRRGEEGREGQQVARRLGCTPAAGRCAPLPTCALSLLGRTGNRSWHAGPLPSDS